MKKALLLIFGLLLLTGCGQKNADVQAGESAPVGEPASISEQSPVIEKTALYRNEKLNISFEYPSNWKIIENKNPGHAVNLISEDDANMYFDYLSESFDEYESERNDLGDSEIGGLKIEEIIMANYPAKKYIEYGVELAAIKYIVEKNGRFIQIGTESGLTEAQKEGLEGILDSLSYQ